MKTTAIGLAISLYLTSSTTWCGAPTPAADEAHATVLKSPDAADFKSSPGVPPCTRAVPMRGDPGKGPASFMAKMDPGCVVPLHWHSVNEELLILSGKVIGQMQGQPSFHLGPRGYAGMPANHVHRFMCAKGGPCTIFVVVDGAFDLHYVNTMGEAITLAQALALDRGAKGKDW